MAKYVLRLCGTSACRSVLSVLLLLAILRYAGPAQAEPTWLIVPGVGVGRVTLGMAVTHVMDTLGTPPAVCLLNPSGQQGDTVGVFYYPDRGLALTVNALTESLGVVGAMHIVAGYSAVLTDERSVGRDGRGYRTCRPHGILTMNPPPSVYTTDSGIRPGSSEPDVVERLGRPQALYPAVAGGAQISADEMESVRLHQMLLIPYPAQIYAYDGIAVGIAHSTVVALTVSQLSRSIDLPAWFSR